MRNLSSLVAGAMFGIGLYLSGMTDTRKVIGFLDLFGDWDPTLAFVMGGAVAVMAIAWRIATRWEVSLSGEPFPARSTAQFEPAFIVGSILFGVGWGLAGLCPGPALASITWGGTGGLVFLVAMLTGMLSAPPIQRRLSTV